MKAAVILSGCGVYDGSEIHEAVLTLLALEENGVQYEIFAPNKAQFHVVNHLNGEEMKEERNVLIESARIARGAAKDLVELNANAFNFLVIPGGFGAAKNLNQWALNGPDGDIDAEVVRVVNDFLQHQKAIVGLCMGPTVIAKALEKSGVHATISVGTTAEASPYDIAAINQGLQKVGGNPIDKTIREIAIDRAHKIVTAPCYMMEASLLEVRKNIQQAIEAVIKLS